MTGSVKWNLVFAIFGFIFIFLLSLTANVWQTSIIRGAIGFFAFFILAFLFRAVWSLIRSAPAINEKEKPEKETGRNNSFEQQPTIDETSAEQTSEMIRSLLKDDDNKRNMNE